ncbi:hypothetical protein C0989_010347 [Termitomyces sp. Mn162]|nr:hypothetical protein C0989_010347 [Termitomyces sp. Mn162]
MLACIGPLSWAYPAEIFSTRTRAKSTAITSSSSWISNLFVLSFFLLRKIDEFRSPNFDSFIAQVTPIAFKHIGWKYYLVFAICGHSNALFIWAFFPETTGRRLEGRLVVLLFALAMSYEFVLLEMDALFENAPIFVPGTSYARVGDRHAGERELLGGTPSFRFIFSPFLELNDNDVSGDFAPGDLSVKDSHDPEKASINHQEL